MRKRTDSGKRVVNMNSEKYDTMYEVLVDAIKSSNNSGAVQITRILAYEFLNLLWMMKEAKVTLHDS